MGLHVHLEVVATAKSLTATLDVTLKVYIFLGGESARLSRTDDRARDAALLGRSGKSWLLLALRSPIIERN
jgi:hypothetical protein